jgi:hypothetical protein
VIKKHEIFMSNKICIAAKTLYYPQAGGHIWVYLNWALGLRSLGCDIVWLEPASPNTPTDKIKEMVRVLKSRLEPFELADCVALYSSTDVPLSLAATIECLDLEVLAEMDLLLNFVYGSIPSSIIRRFRRSALVDIDPGLTQIWMSTGQMNLEQHDIYYTIGETVGQPGARFPDCGLEWHYTPPCVALDWWPVHQATNGAPFTTVSHWHMGEWMEDKDGWYNNDKRCGFLPFLDLPRRTTQPLELALCMKADDEEWVTLPELGWRVRDAWKVTSTPQDYQNYIQGSRGEFSCVKPSCIRLQNAWISDRTICYLACGKPAVVQHTGQSRFLPDSEGLFRFRDMEEAMRYFEIIESNYKHHCQLARKLAEEQFDARKLVKNVLEKAML